MGNFASLSMDDMVERELYFSTLLDTGGTVRDIVRLGLTCTSLQAWVRIMVAGLTEFRLRQLLASVPAAVGGTKCKFWYSNGPRWEFLQGRVGWEIGRVHARLIQFTIDWNGPNDINMDYRSRYCDVLMKLGIATYHGMYDPENVQYYPMLDTAVKHAVGRIQASERAAVLDEDERALKRARV